MSIKITGKGALSQMQNAILAAEKTFKHRLPDEVKRKWNCGVAILTDSRKKAMEQNQKWEAIKNA